MTATERSTIVCPRCKAIERCDGANVTLESIGVFTCDQCRLRVVHGHILPNIVVEPFTDEKGFTWLRRRFQDALTRKDLYVVDVDPHWAALEATNILSITVHP